MLIATYQEVHVQFNWQSCSLIGELKYHPKKVLREEKQPSYQILFGRAHVRVYGRDKFLCSCHTISLYILNVRTYVPMYMYMNSRSTLL